MTREQRYAAIIGAGPAGLTAAYELLKRTDIKPIVFERDKLVGGIARTVVHNGNRIDIGGHRFFSKSDRVMNWWLHFLPLQARGDSSLKLTFQHSHRELAVSPGPVPEETDRVMLVRARRSRIYFNRKFFDYPVSLSLQTLRNLGLWRSFRILFSYLRVLLVPIRQPKNLEEFFVSRFGRELYRTFFESYTEKVWGVPCREISAEWGAQRVKGLSIWRAVLHFLRSFLPTSRDLAQKATETTLIEQFLYPKYGPGQMWEVVAEEVVRLGGEIRLGREVDCLRLERDRIVEVGARDLATGARETLAADYVFSTTDIPHLVSAMGDSLPPACREVAEGLVFRDFLTVGLLVERLTISEADGSPIKDNWIYIQEPDVKVGRLQIFNNWSPYMVADSSKMWLGLEYFCDRGDPVWSSPDDELISFAAEELERIGIIESGDVLDAVVLRMPKTYPAYFGTYSRFGELRGYLDAIMNLYPIGRNGMHRYNNQDHSMLAAMVAVDLIESDSADREALWGVNAEEEYHEERRSTS